MAFLNQMMLGRTNEIVGARWGETNRQWQHTNQTLAQVVPHVGTVANATADSITYIGTGIGTLCLAGAFLSVFVALNPIRDFVVGLHSDIFQHYEYGWVFIIALTVGLLYLCFKSAQVLGHIFQQGRSTKKRVQVLN